MWTFGDVFYFLFLLFLFRFALGPYLAVLRGWQDQRLNPGQIAPTLGHLFSESLKLTPSAFLSFAGGDL